MKAIAGHTTTTQTYTPSFAAVVILPAHLLGELKIVTLD